MESKYRWLWIALGVIVVLALAGSFMAPVRMLGFYGPRPWGAPWLLGFGLGFGVLRLVVWVGLLALLFSFFRRRVGAGRWHGSDFETPEEILDRRFAAGELSREQYEDMRRTLAHQT